MIRALFICSQNRLRSPTAEHLFATYPGIETDSAGLGGDADVPLSVEQIQWASVIFVMEQVHKTRLTQRFRRFLNGKKVICLGIPDEFEYMQDELVALLKKKVEPLL
ncbi:low molecular weight protein tyrosine phosphatase family protein [Chitiniphilus purpureus]|uniref:Low molecular weight protein tyrosine phosphatase family protein n=1 Tax=Chitiniphilus purpureus TaxID=2981137 RepID=A0ABY6DM87_9NEIS|nr:low molecular weight protein tyrosine phosphatase family protein [Chitiniphilus sp. CD1]UXY15489.1 low molecular weight protein tyrosine phosphatase family protein [Chitiniphilus sp. CD1]